jgi:hypothetical protein
MLCYFKFCCIQFSYAIVFVLMILPCMHWAFDFLALYRILLYISVALYEPLYIIFCFTILNLFSVVYYTILFVVIHIYIYTRLNCIN